MEVVNLHKNVHMSIQPVFDAASSLFNVNPKTKIHPNVEWYDFNGFADIYDITNTNTNIGTRLIHDAEHISTSNIYKCINNQKPLFILGYG